ncbi:MAG: hypothetical protein AB7E32_13590 [Desulfovibrio sp.]
MRIEWCFEKKRGNLRPVLTYTATLDEYEIGLCLPMVRFESQLPVPPESYVPFCWPGSHERGSWSPERFHILSTPSHKTGTLTERLTMPWREDNAYPEVEEGFQGLRAAFEEILRLSTQSEPIQQHGEMQTTTAARQCIAAAVLGERLLRAVNPAHMKDQC